MTCEQELNIVLRLRKRGNTVLCKILHIKVSWFGARRLAACRPISCANKVILKNKQNAQTGNVLEKMYNS